MEYFDLYDQEGNKTEQIIKRGEKIPEGYFHLIVHIWIINSKGELLLQRRNKKTDEIPYLLSTHAGAVSTGETSLLAAVREVYEEIGLKLEESELNLLHRFQTNAPFSRFFSDVYYVYKDVDIKTLKLDKTEVKECVYKSFDEVLELVKNKQFFGYELRHNDNYLERLKSVL